MGAQQFTVHRWKALGLIFVSLWIDPGMNLAVSRDTGLPERQSSESLASQRVSFLIGRVIEGSAIKLKDGTSATTTPVLPSNADLQEVKGFGDQAVKALATYVNSTRAMEQHVSLRFLLEFHDDLALAALKAFAEESKFPGIRQEAIAALRGFPAEKVKPILERISKSDSNPDVRAYARHILASYPP